MQGCIDFHIYQVDSGPRPSETMRVASIFVCRCLLSISFNWTWCSLFMRSSSRSNNEHQIYCVTFTHSSSIHSIHSIQRLRRFIFLWKTRFLLMKFVRGICVARFTSIKKNVFHWYPLQWWNRSNNGKSIREPVIDSRCDMHGEHPNQRKILDQCWVLCTRLANWTLRKFHVIELLLGTGISYCADCI